MKALHDGKNSSYILMSFMSRNHDTHFIHRQAESCSTALEHIGHQTFKR